MHLLTDWEDLKLKKIQVLTDLSQTVLRVLLVRMGASIVFLSMIVITLIVAFTVRSSTLHRCL